MAYTHLSDVASEVEVEMEVEVDVKHGFSHE